MKSSDCHPPPPQQSSPVPLIDIVRRYSTGLHVVMQMRGGSWWNCMSPILLGPTQAARLGSLPSSDIALAGMSIEAQFSV